MVTTFNETPKKNTSARLSSWFRGCLVAVTISASSTAAASIAGLGFADVEDIESGTVTYLPALSASAVTTDQGAQVVFGFSTMGGPQNPTWSAPTNTIAITGGSFATDTYSDTGSGYGGSNGPGEWLTIRHNAAASDPALALLSVLTTSHFTNLTINGSPYTSGTALAFDQATAYSYDLCVVYDSEHACITLAKDAGSATLKAADWQVLTLSIQSNDVADGGTSSLPSVDLTFTASEPNAAFTQSNITVTNGSVSYFSIDTTTEFSATITPSGDGLVQVDVPVGLFSAPSSTPFNSAASYSWTYVSDNTPPTMTITATEVSNGGSSLDASLSLTFTASEPTDGDFDENDLVLTNGTISAFTPVSSTVYTATFTPDIPGVATISVPDSTFTDGVGNDNLAATPFTWTYAPDTTAPTMSITATGVSNGDTTDDASLALTFTANEPTTDFVETDITLSGGTLSAFTPVHGLHRHLYPHGGRSHLHRRPAATFTDGAGNDNLAATPLDLRSERPHDVHHREGVSNGRRSSLALLYRQ